MCQPNDIVACGNVTRITNSVDILYSVSLRIGKVDGERGSVRGRQQDEEAKPFCAGIRSRFGIPGRLSRCHAFACPASPTSTGLEVESPSCTHEKNLSTLWLTVYSVYLADAHNSPISPAHIDRPTRNAWRWDILIVSTVQSLSPMSRCSAGYLRRLAR